MTGDTSRGAPLSKPNRPVPTSQWLRRRAHDRPVKRQLRSVDMTARRLEAILANRRPHGREQAPLGVDGLAIPHALKAKWPARRLDVPRPSAGGSCHGVASIRATPTGSSWDTSGGSAQVTGISGRRWNATKRLRADCKSVGLRLRRFESCTCHPGQRVFLLS
jgi:hypothetical protein